MNSTRYKFAAGALFLLFIARATAATTVTGCTALFHTLPSEIVEVPDDSYYPEEHRARFWELHRRFGFLREHDRILLLARDEALALHVVADLAAFSGRRVSDSTWARHPLGGTVIDVTDVLTPLVRALHGRHAMEGQNCGNVCMQQVGISAGASYSSKEELDHWYFSPFSSPVTHVDAMRAGDLITIGFRNQLGGVHRGRHNVVFLSRRLVFHKHGPKERQGYRLVDFDEFYNMAIPSYANHVDVFRVQHFDDMIARNRSVLPPRLVDLWREVHEYERRVERYYLFELGEVISFEAGEVWRERWDRVAAWRKTAKEELSKLAEDPNDVVFSLWQGFLLHVNGIGL